MKENARGESESNLAMSTLSFRIFGRCIVMNYIYNENFSSENEHQLGNELIRLVTDFKVSFESFNLLSQIFNIF